MAVPGSTATAPTGNTKVRKQILTDKPYRVNMLTDVPIIAIPDTQDQSTILKITRNGGSLKARPVACRESLLVFHLQRAVRGEAAILCLSVPDGAFFVCDGFLFQWYYHAEILLMRE